MLSKFLFFSVFCLISLWFIGRIVYPATTHITPGTAAYYTASHLLVTGQISARIYDPTYFGPLLAPNNPDVYNANPPTTTLLMLPFTSFNKPTANRLWIWVNFAMLLTGLSLLIYTFAPHRHYSMLLPILIAMLFRPVITNMQLGQAYITMFFLMVIVVVAHQRAKPPWLGFALGLTILLKAVGLAIIPLLAWQRKRVALIWTVITLLIIITITLPIYGFSMWQTYFQLLGPTLDSSVVCVTAYQTTASLLCRIFGSTTDTVWFNHPFINLPLLNTLTWFALALATFGVILFISKTEATMSLMLVIIWGVLFAPLGEQYHHTVILIPLTWRYLQGLPTWLDKLTFALIVGLYSLDINFNNALYQHGGLTFLAYPRLYGAWLLLIFIIYRHFYPEKTL